MPDLIVGAVYVLVAATFAALLILPPLYWLGAMIEALWRTFGKGSD